jgi:hypothetical protein
MAVLALKVPTAHTVYIPPIAVRWMGHPVNHGAREFTAGVRLSDLGKC